MIHLFAKLVFLLSMTSAALVSAADKSETCISEFCFSQNTSVGSTAIPLLGLGQVRYLGFLGYTAALYGPRATQSPESILSPVPKKLVIDYYRTIEPEAFIKSSEKFMRENPQNNWAEIEPGFQLMNTLYSTVNRGDRYEISFEPGKGLSLALNGSFKGTVPGDAFAKAYFGIWLSDFPISKTLRDKLLAVKK